MRLYVARGFEADGARLAPRTGPSSPSRTTLATSTSSTRASPVIARSVASRSHRSDHAGSQGNLDEAEALIEGARARGLPGEVHRRFVEGIEAARPWPLRFARRAGTLLVAWLACVGVLLGAGALLSLLTLRATRDPSASRADPGVGERLVRRAYSAVIALTCGLYFLSIPIVLGLVPAVGGAIVFGLLAIPRRQRELLKVGEGVLVGVRGGIDLRGEIQHVLGATDCLGIGHGPRGRCPRIESVEGVRRTRPCAHRSG